MPVASRLVLRRRIQDVGYRFVDGHVSTIDLGPLPFVCGEMDAYLVGDFFDLCGKGWSDSNLST